MNVGITSTEYLQFSELFFLADFRFAYVRFNFLFTATQFKCKERKVSLTLHLD